MAKIVSSVAIVLLVFTIVTSAAPQYFIFKDFNSVFSGNVNTGFGNSNDNDQPSSNAIGSVDDRGESQGSFPFWEPPTIDYEKIAEIIDEKVEEELMKLNLSADGSHAIKSPEREIVSNCSNSNGTKDRLCEERSGYFYEGKCYFALHISYSSQMNYEQARQNCSSEDAMIGEIHSRAQQEFLENFFRSKIPSSTVYIQLWTGMTYRSSGRKLQFRSGKEVPITQLKWYRGYPSAAHDKVALGIRNNGQHLYEGLFNRAASGVVTSGLCEI